jgi:hypothetical protein
MLVRMQVTATILYDCNRNNPKLAESVSKVRLLDDLARFGKLESISVAMACNRTVRILASVNGIGKYVDVVCAVDGEDKNVITADMLAKIGISADVAYTQRDSTDKHITELTITA